MVKALDQCRGACPSNRTMSGCNLIGPERFIVSDQTRALILVRNNSIDKDSS